MSLPILTPTSQTSAIILPITGNTDNVAAATPLGVYDSSTEFLSGAAAQVAFTYKRLGGDVLDIEVEDSIFSEDKQVVLDLIKAACNDANSKRDKVKSEKMGGMFSKMGLPEDFNFPFTKS